MQLISVELRNIKSYADEGHCVTFRPGVNLICGENGSGKSTLLEAIGYALFDSLDYRQADLCREGESQGEIVVTFQSPVDERTYQVVRAVGPSAFYIYDPQTKTRLVEQKSDTADWLAEHLAVDLSFAGKLFSDAIGVSQGRMTASFLETPANRRNIFNPLLRVDEYQAAWEKLRVVRGHLDEKLQSANQHAAGLRGELKRLPDVIEEHDNLHGGVEQTRKCLAELGQRLDALQAEATTLEQAYKRVDNLKRLLVEVEAMLASLKDQERTAQAEASIAHEAAAIVEESKEGHASYREAERERATLEEQREKRDQQRQALQVAEAKLSTVNNTLSHIDAELAKAQQAEERLQELAPLVAEQEQWEQALQDAHTQLQEREQASQRVNEEIQRLEFAEKKLAIVRAHLEERKLLEREQADLESKRAGIVGQREELNEKLAPLLARLNEQQNRVTEARQQIQKLEHATQRAKEAAERVERYRTELQKVEDDLEEQEWLQMVQRQLVTQIDEQRAALATSTSEQEIFAQQVKLVNKRREVLRSTEGARCPVCHEPLAAERADTLAREAETEIQGLESQRERACERAAHAKQRLEVLEQERKECEAEVGKRATRARAEELKSSIKEQEQERSRWETRTKELADAPATIKTLLVQQKSLKEEMASVQAQQQARTKEDDELRAELQDLNQVLVQLPLSSRLTELKEEMAAVQASRVRHQARVDELAGSTSLLEEAEAALDALGNPRQEQAGQRAISAGRADLETRRQTTLQERAALEEERGNQQAALKQFTALEEALVQVRAQLTRHEADHERYVSHLKTAETLDTREKALADVRERHAAQAERRDGLARQYQAATANYAAERHAEVKQAVSDANREVVSLRAQLKVNEERLERVAKERATLGEVEERLQAVERSLDHLQQLEEGFKFVRGRIRDAGPAVVKRRVQGISHQANQFFLDIMGQPSYQLTWDDSYGITVHRRGRQRAFNQLSGGEQMAAAISVRLALLMQMSQLRILFLDEPTTNLDDQRRDKLADRISQLKELKQIFVITHDDAFERETHHVLRVRKSDGVSQVEAGF